jgi:hypothetical protein
MSGFSKTAGTTMMANKLEIRKLTITNPWTFVPMPDTCSDGTESIGEHPLHRGGIRSHGNLISICMNYYVGEDLINRAKGRLMSDTASSSATTTASDFRTRRTGAVP